jgi:glycosyltransferase involved in cell wall biosynthesis
MKILYDHQMFYRQNHGGITRYFVELIKGLNNIGSIDIQLSVGATNNNYLKELSNFIRLNDELNVSRNHGFFSKLFLKKNSPVDIIDQSIRLIKEGNFDVFHPTFYDHYFLEHISQKKYVLTVHDLITQKYPEFFIEYETPDKSTRILEGASHIIAISETTKRDLVNYFFVDESKISVIYHGSPQKKDIEINDIQKLDYEYLLFVGERRGYKNFYSFLLSIKDTLLMHKNLKLVCVGSPFANFEIKYFESLYISNKIFNLTPDDEGLQILYENAVALVYPSIDEGFGLPILEAFVNGCPVLCSDIKVFHEIANDSVVYFDPKSIKSINDAFYRIYNSKKEKQNLIEKGYERSKTFDWSKCASLTKEVYKKVISQ